MPMQFIEQPDVPETTYKAREVEGILDLYFYRKIGFWLAQFFARLNVTPTAVSLYWCLMRRNCGSPLLLSQFRNKYHRHGTACLRQCSR